MIFYQFTIKKKTLYNVTAYKLNTFANVYINFVHMYAGFGATVNVAKPKPNNTVAVFGLGAVGLAVCYPSRLFPQ